MKVLSIQKKQKGFSLARVSKERGKSHIHLLRTFPDSSSCHEEIEKSLAPDQKSELEIASSLSAKDSFYRTLTLPLSKKKQVEKILPFEIEALLPYPEEEGVVQYSYEIKDETCVALGAVKKEALAPHIAEIEQSGLEPDWVGLAPWSLYLFCKEYCPEHTSLLVLYRGEEESTLLMIVEGRLLSSLFIPYGKNSSVIKESYFQRALQFCLEKDKERKTTRYLLLGEEMETGFFVKSLPSSFQEVFITSSFDPKTLSQYALEIGGALNVLSPQTMQFRRGKNMSRKHLRGIRKKIVLTALSAFLAPLLLFVVCQNILFQQERHVNLLLGEMTITTQAPLNLKDPRFFSAKTTLNQQQEALEGLRLHVEKKNPFSSFQKLPLSVTEILHAIATHPLLETEAELDSFHYEICSAPDFEKPTQDYKIKVDVVLTGEDSTKFKDFFQQIKEKGDPFIHAKKECSYTREGNRHTFSFAFKDKS
jgi:type IV pilus assembly protein PilM